MKNRIRWKVKDRVGIKLGKVLNDGSCWALEKDIYIEWLLGIGNIDSWLFNAHHYKSSYMYNNLFTYKKDMYDVGNLGSIDFIFRIL